METKKEYYWILMEKICDEWELTRTRLVPKWTDGCYSIRHETIKQALTFSGDMEKLNNL